MPVADRGEDWIGVSESWASLKVMCWHQVAMHMVVREQEAVLSFVHSLPLWWGCVGLVCHCLWYTIMCLFTYKLVIMFLILQLSIFHSWRWGVSSLPIARALTLTHSHVVTCSCSRYKIQSSIFHPWCWGSCAHALGLALTHDTITNFSGILVKITKHWLLLQAQLFLIHSTITNYLVDLRCTCQDHQILNIISSPAFLDAQYHH